MFSSQKNMDILIRALDAYAKECDEALPMEEGSEAFSEAFEKNMQNLIKRQKRFYFSYIHTFGKRAACIALVVIVGLFATVFSVKALREPFVDFVVETYNKFTKIFTAGEQSNINEKPVFEIYEPQYIPQGFTAEESVMTDAVYNRIYTTTDGRFIDYSQGIGENAQSYIDAETTVYEKIFVHSFEAVYYESKGVNGVVFSDGYYIFSVSGYVSKEDILKIAESITIKD